MAAAGENVLMVSPDGEMAQVPPAMVDAAKARGARVISHNAQIVAKYADMIPALTGFAGALGGGILAGGPTAGAAAIPGAVAGGVAGGAVGEGLRIGARNLLGYPMPNAGQAAGQMLHEGAMQGAMSALGEIPAAVSGAVGRGFMTSALRPENQMQLETAIRGNIPVGPRPMLMPGPAGNGAQAIAAAKAGPAQALNTLIDLADKAGHKIPLEDVLGELDQLHGETIGIPTAEGHAQVYGNVLDAMRKKYGTMLKPSQVQKLKQDMQALLENQYSKANAGSPVALTPMDAATNQARAAIASGAKRSLEQIGAGEPGSGVGTSLGHEIARANRKLSPLMDLGPSLAWEEAGPNFARNPGPESFPNVQQLNGRAPQPVTLGAAAKGLDIPMLLAGNNPAVASRLGLLLARPAGQEVARNIPRAALAAYQMSQIQPAPAMPDALSPQGGRQ